MKYSKIRREQSGRCNLCRNEGRLSWDHVPPKGGIDLTAVEIRNVLETLTNKPGEGRYRISQNGIKYRTICKACNEWLGQEYDPVLNQFARDVAKFLRSNLELPNIAKIRTTPHRLIRGLLGHLLAAKAEYDEVVLDETVRDFIFNPDAKVPENISIFYWIYPFPIQVVLRDVAMPAVRGDYSEFIFCHLLKYFPVAYLVGNKPQYERLFSLNRYRHAAPDDEFEIEVSLQEIKNQTWPEAPEEGNFLFGGASMESSAFGTPKK